MNTFNNEQVANLPPHLAKYIVDQRYEKYTPLDHAVWRYVMRQNYSFLKDAAYYPYIPGLKMAGLTIEKIPSLQEINDALANIGWGAVTVDGFIPPAAFMEFQAYRVLVIAADIRQLEYIEYTSAPDIIHESAGHAPIISDTDYNQYLSYLGFIGTKAIFSSKDFELYETIRQLSILKEMPGIDEDFDSLGLRYKTNKSTHSIHVIGYGDIIFRSYDNPDRIVAYSVGHSIVDELDTLPKEKAMFVNSTYP